MTTRLLVGPLLGLESDTLYTVCFRTDRSVRQAQVRFNGQAVAAQAVGETWGGTVWRAEHVVPLQDAPQQIRYAIHLDDQSAYNQDGAEWSFHVPGRTEKPRLLYASCNGFSSPDLAVKTERPYILWGKIRKFQLAEMAKVAAGEAGTPYALMLLGAISSTPTRCGRRCRCCANGAMSARKRNSGPRLRRRCSISSTGFTMNCINGAGASRSCR